VFLLVGAMASASVAHAEPPPAASASAPSAAAVDLEGVLAPLGDANVETRRSAAKAASELAEDALPAMTKKLAELRGSSASAMATAMRAVRDKHGARSSDKTFDLVAALVEMRADATGARAALTVACLLRSLAKIGTTPAARQIVLASSDAGGAFRAEASRRMAQLGDRAMPALIEARAIPEARAWAGGMLESLGKHMASDAVQTQDNQVLADVLRAYGAVKDLDALRVILSFANSDRVQVRAAARDAIALYGNDGAFLIRDAYAAAAGKPANEGWTPEQLTKGLFEALDRARLQEVYALLDDGLAKARAGKLEDAVAAFDTVLARQPMLDRRAETVTGYVQYARAIEERDRAAALAYLRKAQRLDPDGPRAKEIESEIVYLEAEELLARGVVDLDAFKRALALDPTNERASSEVSRIEAERESKAQSVKWWTAAAAAFAALLSAVILFGGRSRRASARAR
jgi:hypothetical protein